MEIFLLLLTNLTPLYLLIAAGYLVGKFLHVDGKSIASVAIFLCMPMVMFGFVSQMELRPEYFILPVIIWALHTSVGLSFFLLGKQIYPDVRANLLGMMTSTGNAGYFGLPLALLLFNEQIVAIYMFMILGNIVYEATFNYYFAARGQFTVRDSLIKLMQFPSIYAIAAGLLVNYSGADMPGLFITYWTYFKGAYVILGMLIIGVALAAAPKLVFPPKFLSLVFLGKFLLWPVLVTALILFDQAVLGWYSSEIYKLFWVMAIVPPAANSVAFATQFNVRPEKAASTVLIATVFALVYIPVMLVVFELL